MKEVALQIRRMASLIALFLFFFHGLDFARVFIFAGQLRQVFSAGEVEELQPTPTLEGKPIKIPAKKIM
jgi:hypothetical protein